MNSIVSALVLLLAVIGLVDVVFVAFVLLVGWRRSRRDKARIRRRLLELARHRDRRYDRIEPQ